MSVSMGGAQELGSFEMDDVAAEFVGEGDCGRIGAKC
jgi:hypothetical protein